MKYLFLLHVADESLPEFGTPEYNEMFAAWRSATEALARQVF
ncbi:MAG TPA: hypothetical protein VLL25_01015 [Acidimicrobiales bacterium]|nr:hypothetical protein [Acidimicrobiales bacterium]